MNTSSSNPIITIDCNYLLPEFAAAYLVPEAQEVLFVENNTAHAVPQLLQALNESGFKPTQVKYLIVTHIHLDHAGGTSQLLKHCPNATVLAHPKAAPHLIDPTRLVASAKKVYGETRFQEMYGEILPIHPDRVRVMKDQETLSFGTRELKFIYTQGHANHHFCIFDSKSQGIFTGDSFGIAYPPLQKNGLFILPSTSPTDFDPVQAKLSIQKILDTGAKQAYLTHFGTLTHLEEAAQLLLKHLDFSEAVLESAIHSQEPDEALDAFCMQKLEPYVLGLLSQQGLKFDRELIQLDLQLNASGIAHVARKRRRT